MVLWFNDAIFDLNAKTKGNWERAEFQNSHELFRKTRKGVLGLFPFHPFPMDEYFNQQHDKKGAWVGLKPDLQGGTRFNLLRVQFWNPVQKKRI